VAESNNRYVDFDLHTHTSEHSACAKLPAAEVVRLAEQQGLHGVAFTDHHYCWSNEEIERLREKTGTSLVLLSGQEITLAGIDFLVFGWSGSDPHVQTIAQFVELVQEGGGAVLVAHPWCVLYTLEADTMTGWGVDGVEVCNSLKGRPPEAEIVKIRGSGLAECAGSDFHQPVFKGALGNCFTRFGFPVRTVRDLVRAVRNRRIEAVIYE
jgi:predicted metal-dependent phosphoesterase TrpH